MKPKKKYSIPSDETLTNVKRMSTKSFSPQDINSIQAKNDNQRTFLDAAYGRFPIVAQIGAAGTGKTFLALHSALSLVLGGSYRRVIIVRSCVQTRDIGFLPGTKEEKDEPYERVYKGMCDEILKFKSNNYDNLKALGKIEFVDTSFLRGETFDNSIILVDEVQNMTYHELSTITTRIGINTKMFLCGDSKQNDLSNKKGNEKSGLEKFLYVIKQMPFDSKIVINYTIDDIVRSGLVKDFLIADFYHGKD